MPRVDKQCSTAWVTALIGLVLVPTISASLSARGELLKEMLADSLLVYDSLHAEGSITAAERDAFRAEAPALVLSHYSSLQQPAELRVPIGGAAPIPSQATGITTRQLAEGQSCAGDVVERVGLACCQGGHRRLQDGGCDSPPSSCSQACAEVFVPFFGTCGDAFTDPDFEQLNVQCLDVLNGGGDGGDQSCVYSTTWISAYEKVGCAQYAPGLTSWQSMCEVSSRKVLALNRLAECFWSGRVCCAILRLTPGTSTTRRWPR